MNAATTKPASLCHMDGTTGIVCPVACQTVTHTDHTQPKLKRSTLQERSKHNDTQEGKSITRKDYVAIAEALADSQMSNARSLEEAQHWYAQWCTCAQTIADVLAADNPRFDRDRFYRACEGDK